MNYSRNVSDWDEEEVDLETGNNFSSRRFGKWTVEEERFAQKLIAEFNAGTLTDCPERSTLRSYLSRRLNCTPMRISKKFAGQCIGKVKIFNELFPAFHQLTIFD